MEDSEESRKIWDRQFRFNYKIVLRSRELQLFVEVENLGSGDPLDMTLALHTYFRVPDVTKCTVSNLKGLTYADKVLGGQESVEGRDLVMVDQFTDRAYKNAPDAVELTGLEGGRVIKLSKVKKL